MKKSVLGFLLIGLLIGGMGIANDVSAQTVSVVLAWDAPTHRASATDCSVNGVALTAAEVATVEYTVSYRLKGATAWTNKETGTNETVTLVGLPYLKTYEVSVGAHWQGDVVQCATALLEFSTGAGPAPGPCSGLRRIIGP